MKKRKICVTITTRGNYAKMKSVLECISKDPKLELQLIVAGGALLPKYGNIEKVMQANKVKIDRVIYFLVEGENTTTMAKSAGLAVVEFSTAFENMKPDVVIVIADRFESLAISMAASYLNVPLAHIEGGEISGSIDESIRHAITKLSHLHFPATKEASERIKKMGEDPGTVFQVGCTSFDVFQEIDMSNAGFIEKLQKTLGVGAILDMHKPYLIVIQHPVTTEYEKTFGHIQATISAIDSLKINTFWIWPNMDAGADALSHGIREFRELKNPDYIHFFKSLSIEHFAPLLKNAACIVGNSSCGIREASFLGTPCVNIGTRQAGRQRGKNVVDVDYDSQQIQKSIKEQINRGHFQPDYIYGDGNSCKKIVDIIRDFEFNIQKRIQY